MSDIRIGSTLCARQGTHFASTEIGQSIDHFSKLVVAQLTLLDVQIRSIVQIGAPLILYGDVVAAVKTQAEEYCG